MEASGNIIIGQCEEEDDQGKTIIRTGKISVKGVATSNGLDISGVTYLNEMFLCDNITINGAVLLPTYLINEIKEKAQTITITLGENAKVLGAKIEVQENNIFVSKYDKDTGIKAIRYEETKPIEDYATISISDIAKDATANVSDDNNNILDITEDEEVAVLNQIIYTSDPIYFTILTTPSKGITIADGVNITEPLYIRLKLGGE